MSFNSLRYVFINTTTVDNLTRSSRHYSFAVLIDEGQHPQYRDSRWWDNKPFITITYPLSGHASVGLEPGMTRTFAVIPAPAGSNPYNLPSALSNFRAVLGDHWYDWLLPLRESPCCTRRKRYLESDQESLGTGGTLYDFGDVMARMKQDNGIVMSS